MPYPSAIIWDMDGVLADTTLFHFNALKQILLNHGQILTFEQFIPVYGMNNLSTMKALLGPEPSLEMLDQITRQKDALFRCLLHGQAQTLPGVRSWLEYFRTQSYPQALASSAPQVNINAIIGEIQIDTFFGAVVNGDALPSKPAPQIFLTAAGKLGAAPEDCVVIEDSAAGVEAAKRAGMRCIAVTTTNPPQALQAADLVLNRLSDLPPQQALCQAAKN